MIFGDWLVVTVTAVGFFIGAAGVGGIARIPDRIWLSGVPILSGNG